jgi:hypothetical protein
VDMGGLIAFVGKETEFIRPRNRDRWHGIEIAAAA